MHVHDEDVDVAHAHLTNHMRRPMPMDMDEFMDMHADFGRARCVGVCRLVSAPQKIIGRGEM